MRQTLLKQLDNGEIGKVLAELKSASTRHDDLDAEEAILQISKRFKTLEENFRNKQIKQSEYKIELVNIRRALSALLLEIPDDWFAEKTNGQSSSPSKKEPEGFDWKKWGAIASAIVGVMAGITGFSGYTLKDIFGDGGSDELTNVTVFVHSAKNKQDMILQQQGHVIMDVAGERKMEPIDEKGQAHFKNLKTGEQARLGVEFSEPYRAVHPDSTYHIEANEGIYLAVALQGLDKIFGTATWDEQPLEGVVVSIGDLLDTTDALGHYTLTIPEALQKKEQQVQFFKEGFQMRSVNFFPQTSQPLDVPMKK